MSDLSFPVRNLRGLPVVTAPDEIDITNADQLRAALLEAAGSGHASLVVDMTSTRFCDSAGINALVRAHKRAEAEGGELRLVIPSVAVLRAFAVAGIDRVIPHFSTVDEALAPTPAVKIRLSDRGLPPQMRILDGLVTDPPDQRTPDTAS
jgi:anti-anti-sigma factor